MNQLPIQSLRIKYAIGIDPDIDKSGYAVWNKLTNTFDQVACLGFAALINEINCFEPGIATFYVDAGWLNQSVWHGEPPNAVTWSIKSRLANAAEIGRRVGENAGVGKSIVHYLSANQHEVHEVKPTVAKWDAATCKQYTGWEKRTNAETRDAMRLCFQR